MARLGVAATVVILLLTALITASCAGTSWTCQYDGYTDSSVTCSYQGTQKFKTTVAPPEANLEETQDPYLGTWLRHEANAQPDEG